MQYTKLKQFMLLLALFLPSAWCSANTTNIVDGVSHINIKESSVQNVPRGSSIHASINGHYFSNESCKAKLHRHTSYSLMFIHYHLIQIDSESGGSKIISHFTEPCFIYQSINYFFHYQNNLL